MNTEEESRRSDRWIERKREKMKKYGRETTKLLRFLWYRKRNSLKLQPAHCKAKTAPEWSAGQEKKVGRRKEHNQITPSKEIWHTVKLIHSHTHIQRVCAGAQVLYNIMSQFESIIFHCAVKRVAKVTSQPFFPVSLSLSFTLNSCFLHFTHKIFVISHSLCSPQFFFALSSHLCYAPCNCIQKVIWCAFFFTFP